MATRSDRRAGASGSSQQRSARQRSLHGNRIGKPALSISQNERFGQLIEAVISARNITVMCGAGVSLDAGLPSWPGLLNRVAQRRAKDGDPLAQLLLDNEPDLMRAAGLIVRKRSGSPTLPDYGLISTELYDGRSDASSSTLAQRIAQFALSDPTAIAIATTNFDDLLEMALEDEEFRVVSCSLDKALKRWWTAFDSPQANIFHVLHLHGYLGSQGGSDKVLGPLVLTEDQFRQHGADVQANVRTIIDKSDLVLCLGMSMTDPDILGPLGERSRLAKSNEHVFVTSVPGRVAESSRPTAATSETLRNERSRYIEEIFGVRVVPLNAYSQLPQLMVELELARSRPRAYLSKSPRHCVRYGYRLSRSLRSVYTQVGFPLKGNPTGLELQMASDRLDAILKALRPQLTKLVMSHDNKALQDLTRELEKRNGALRDHFSSEGLGLFLWLPDPFDPTDKESSHEYRLKLIGASAYTHRDYWSFRRTPVRVNAYDDTAQGRAAFYGQALVEPCKTEHEPRLWRTNVAVPLEVASADDLSQVSVGVIVLASDRVLSDEAPISDRAAVSFLDKAGRTDYARLLASELSLAFKPRSGLPPSGTR